MQIHLDLSYADAKVLRAFAQFVTTSAEAAEVRQAAAEAEKRELIARGGYAQEIAPTSAVASAIVKTEAAQAVAEPAPAPAAEKKPRAKKVAEPEPVKAEAEETCLDVKPSAEAQQELPLDDGDSTPVPTIDDLRRHLRTYGQANGAEALSALYAEYGAKQLSDLPPEKYADIIAKVSA